ncbi:hypothetical protein EDB83DRAFT_2551226 [Lactarius deliciosus]|nr:hypothetical protein EDB83DRAFT_2551226 [Lactarius deliciosus]
MTDWKNPAVVKAEFAALIKFFHAMGGVLIWEFLVNLGFDYSFFTGKRKFRSSFLLYLGARWFPLFAVVGILVGFDSANRINCQTYVIFVFTFSHLSFAFASALIVLRIAAIWGLNKIAISIASAAWLANTGSQIHSIAVVHATWSGSICEITNTHETKTNILVTFITDLVLLALMLTGLLRGKNAHQRGGVWWILYTQGLAWMIIVVVAEVPATVFILLNRNDPMNLMFQVPALIIMAIGASRVYRGLADYFLHNEANVHMSGGLPVRQPPIGCLVPYPDQRSLALGTSGLPDGPMFKMGPLAPPKHRFRPGENDEVW